MAGLPIRQDYAPFDLRERDTRASLRLLAIANALEGMTRAEAARLAGMESQALHDAIQRFNAEGPDALHDRHRSGRPEQLASGQQAALKAHILRGPEPERDGVSAWRLVDLCEHVERTYGVHYSEWGLVPAQAAEPVAPEDPALAPEGQSGRANGVQKRNSRQNCRPSRPSTLRRVFNSGARTRRALARRAGLRASGMSVG
ncbi:helix-turn-helix domain containing protein [Microvirga aerilata]|uniref:Helix-turn-helix domain containing protein n=1 Tax=Microvirga aerilata TaxID=670292 RepID=A0A937D2Q3_9HYPH|nr:helix-turn-helix domain-containing protein [Microvirga aerilata]MBL0405525.1 helix-turn-helix domain containing protein [Microvirga aerilata]